MATNTHETLFALDCGATNWRLYRVGYKVSGGKAQIIGEPQPSPLTSFVDRKLPAVILLNPEGTAIESIGEVAQQQLENEETRERVREYFKPCIGAHLEANPLPHQKRFTHAQALEYTKMLLRAVIDQIRQEKWPASDFDERLWFAFAYPVHWRYDHEGVIFEEFKQTVLDCFPEGFHDHIRFVPEPEGAILSLQRQGLLTPTARNGVTLITDVGGSTTDIVAGEIDNQSGEIRFRGRYGEPFGGGLYDAALAKYIADVLQIPASALADDPSAMVTMRVFGQRLKESLSRQLLQPGNLQHVPQRTITLVMANGEIYRRVIKLDEAIFNEVAGNLNREFEGLMDRAMRAMGLKEQEVGQVALVGGGAQLFTIVRHLRQRFGDQTVVLADNPEEIVVQGIGLEYGRSFTKARPTISFSVPAQGAEKVSKADEPSKPGQWKLVSDDEQHLLGPDGATKIGRDRSNHIQLTSDKVSRFHAELRFVEGRPEITDLKSTNGTFVNEERLAPHRPYRLRAGDEIRFGNVKYTCVKS